MRATSFCCSTSSLSHTSRQFNLLPNPPPLQLGFPNFKTCGGKRSVLKLVKNGDSSRRAATSSSMSVPLPSPWDDKPYEILPGGIRSYFDEQDVVSFLDPPKPLIPLDPSSFNPAAYLQKKIADIPEERRHRLLSLLNPGLISRAWTIAGTRYKAPKLAKRVPSGLLGSGDGEKSLEFWNCRTSGGPAAIAWINSFKKALFCSGDGKTYGRVIGNHPWPFNDEVVIYVRSVGPGVLVGQAWQEGEELEVVPKKLCDEILMVKDYGASSGTW